MIKATELYRESVSTVEQILPVRVLTADGIVTCMDGMVFFSDIVFL